MLLCCFDERLSKMPKPVFCPDCRTRDTFERKPEGDWVNPEGKVLWEVWVCKVCGHKTLRRKEIRNDNKTN